MLRAAIFGFGLCIILLLFFKFSRYLYIYLRPSSLPRYHHGPLPYALISGSTSGLGLSLAHELLSRNFNIILHGNTPAKLRVTQNTLLAAFPNRKIRTFLADATSADPAIFSRLSKLLDDLDGNLTIVINNVGGAPHIIPETYKPFAQNSSNEISKMLRFNIEFAMQLTRTAMPKLLQSTPALIITIGSHADIGSPYLTTYSAAKAACMTWSRALKAEMQAEMKEVEVLGVMSGKTGTGTTEGAKLGIWVPGGKTMARGVLGKIGCGRDFVSGYWGHEVQRVFLEAMPEGMARWALIKALKRLRDGSVVGAEGKSGKGL
jgi:17beta-estradiol 17-dehydrogenase / very-long-chain 3-oxoacyl-CoA reductase